jgi:hypothetical protein
MGDPGMGTFGACLLHQKIRSVSNFREIAVEHKGFSGE